MPLPTFRIRMTPAQLIVLASFYFVIFLNARFFLSAHHAYSFFSENAGFLVSLALLLVATNMLLLSLVGYRRTIKPLLMVLLPMAALSAYFMDTYSTVIDDGMLRNLLETDFHEASDLFSKQLVLYFFWFGLLPALLLKFVEFGVTGAMRRTLPARVALLVAPVVAIIFVLGVYGDQYASFFREHKTTRQYANPIYPIYSLAELIGNAFDKPAAGITPVGLDAALPATDLDRELIVLVVGETARADRFSLNGYSRDTNPLLSQENIFSFNNAWSCGTSTSISLPCMFSFHSSEKPGYSKDSRNFENLLDVLHRAGVSVLWRDNNSGSKGVADRVRHEDFRDPGINPVCDIECRDVGMLAELQEFIDARDSGDILIVLHQMGNHGPAYFKRYPREFEYFSPVCRSSELNACSKEEIDNAYDNAIRYTDYFLAQVIALLKQNDVRFETAMLYVSDHGESLGESGLYLHGMPYALAPNSQKHIPMLAWFGKNYDDVNIAELTRRMDDRFTHDNVFHTLLGLMEIQSTVYRSDMDMLPHYASHADSAAPATIVRMALPVVRAERTTGSVAAQRPNRSNQPPVTVRYPQ